MIRELASKRFANPSRLAGREELLTAAKAIHDGVVEEMNGRWKDGLVMQMTRMFEAEMIKRIDAVREQFDDRAALLEKALVDAEIRHAGEMAALEKSYGNRAAELEKSYSVRVEGLQTAYEAGQGQIKMLLEKMESPTFQAVVPENAIQINQLPSVVNLPENSIRVDVKQLPSVVNVPKDAIRVENKNAAAQVTLPKDAIQVQVQHKTIVEQPKRKSKTTKSILYDAQSGRPDKIVEETEEG